MDEVERVKDGGGRLAHGGGRGSWRAVFIVLLCSQLVQSAHRTAVARPRVDRRSSPVVHVEALVRVDVRHAAVSVHGPLLVLAAARAGGAARRVNGDDVAIGSAAAFSVEHAARECARLHRAGRGIPSPLLPDVRCIAGYSCDAREGAGAAGAARKLEVVADQARSGRAKRILVDGDELGVAVRLERVRRPREDVLADEQVRREDAPHRKLRARLLVALAADVDLGAN